MDVSQIGITSKVSIEIVDSPHDAPDYNISDETFILLKVDKCIIVGKGMETGDPSVDIQLSDKDGNKFLIMATGGIMEMIGSAVSGKRIKDNG